MVIVSNSFYTHQQENYRGLWEGVGGLPREGVLVWCFGAGCLLVGLGAAGGCRRVADLGGAVLGLGNSAERRLLGPVI